MLWFNFILGLIFISLCFGVWQCMIMSLKQWEIIIKPSIKLNHNVYTVSIESSAIISTAITVSINFTVK